MNIRHASSVPMALKGISVVALLAAIFVPIISSGASTAGSTCQQPIDPYSLSSSAVAECGFTVSPLESATTTANGSTTYVYGAEGAVETFVVPPQSFDASTATAAQLAEYNIPAQPPSTQPSKLALWNEMVNNLHFATPPTRLISVPVAASTATTSANWSGYIDTAATNAYASADGIYVEPSRMSTSCSSNAALVWSGLGGYHITTDLAQDGTALNVPSVGIHQAWWEIRPGALTPLPLYATAGSDFESFVRHVSGTTYSFFLYNYSTGSSLGFNETGGSAFDGTTAEYIVERPTVNGSLWNLTNLGTVQFVNTSSNSNSAGSYANYQVTMWPSGGSPMETPGSISVSTGQFSDTFDQCSP